MRNDGADGKNVMGVFGGVIVSLVKIFIVLIITLTFIFYLTDPPGTRSFLTGTSQSDTIVRTVDPV